MVLVDTSVWIDHFRGGDYQLIALLNENKVLAHPLVIGELACGNLQNRKTTLKLLERLGQCKTISNTEARYFLEENQLMGIGIGFIDLHLLGSTALQMNALVWTRDKRLRKAAENLGLAAPYQ